MIMIFASLLALGRLSGSHLREGWPRPNRRPVWTRSGRDLNALHRMFSRGDVPPRWRIQAASIYLASPIVSAILAPRAPIGALGPAVLSFVVWCSISEFSSAPKRTTIVDIHIHIIMPIAAPNEP
jgi:hypothetical protein